MQELIASMMKFSAAMTLFSMQQLQNAVTAAADTQSAMNKFKDALDSMTSAVSSQMDESKKATLESMSKVQNDIVDRTFDAMNLQAFDPREMMHTTGDLMRKTTDSLADLVKKAMPAAEKAAETAKEAAAEPMAAAAALTK
jgi:ABC-type transporter Mla subunit MlaD